MATTIADLAVRARGGDREAWGGLVRRHLGPVHAVCRFHGLVGEPADRVAEAVWVRLAEALPRLAEPEALGPWVTATAHVAAHRWVVGSPDGQGPARTSARPGAGTAAAGPPPGEEPPPGWLDTALSVFEWVACEAAAAPLAYEAVERGGAPGVGGTQRLAFVAPHCTVEVAVLAGPEGVRVDGRLDPPGRLRVRALWPGGGEATEADRDGAFRFAGLPARALAFAVACPSPVKTGWLLPDGAAGPHGR